MGVREFFSAIAAAAWDDPPAKPKTDDGKPAAEQKPFLARMKEWFDTAAAAAWEEGSSVRSYTAMKGERTRKIVDGQMMKMSKLPASALDRGKPNEPRA